MMLSLTQCNPHFVIATLRAKIRLTLHARAYTRARYWSQNRRLMALCDRLEASLTATATNRHLLDALLVEAVALAEGRDLEAAE